MGQLCPNKQSQFQNQLRPLVNSQMLFQDVQQFKQSLKAVELRASLAGPFPQVHNLKVQSYNFICTHKYSISYSVQIFPYRLNNINKLSLQQAAYLWLILTKADLILRKFKYRFNQQKVGIREDGSAVIWLNQNYFQSTGLQASSQQNISLIKSCLLRRNNSRELIQFMKGQKKMYVRPHPITSSQVSFDSNFIQLKAKKVDLAHQKQLLLRPQLNSKECKIRKNFQTFVTQESTSIQ